MFEPKLKLAMRIGGEYQLTAVSGRHWRRFATANELEPDALLARIDDLAARTPDALSLAVKDDAVRSLHSSLPSNMLDLIAGRAQRCRQALQR